jgi:hypothetical protein
MLQEYVPHTPEQHRVHYVIPLSVVTIQLQRKMADVGLLSILEAQHDLMVDIISGCEK